MTSEQHEQEINWWSRHKRIAEAGDTICMTAAIAFVIADIVGVIVWIWTGKWRWPLTFTILIVVFVILQQLFESLVKDYTEKLDNVGRKERND